MPAEVLAGLAREQEPERNGDGGKMRCLRVESRFVGPERKRDKLCDHYRCKINPVNFRERINKFLIFSIFS